MGSLAGHVLPGCFFLAHGLLWAILSIWLYLKNKTTNPKKIKRDGVSTQKSSSFFEYKRDHRLVRKSWIPFPCCPRLPLEPILKILLTFVGIIAEAFFDIRQINTNGDHRLMAVVYHATRNGMLTDLAKLHHITMYGGFFISGIIDLVSICIKLPRQASQIFFALAFWIEWMLFYSHSDSNNPLNVHIHFLLTIVILSCVIFAGLRVFQSSHFLINLGLAFCIMLQGTWFIQVGISLYPPSGTNILLKTIHENQHGGHSVTMYIYALFTWHVLFLALSFLGLWIALACFAKSGVNRRLSSKLSNNGLTKSNRDFMDSEENEQLITVDDGGSRDKYGLTVGIEMQEIAETVP